MVQNSLFRLFFINSAVLMLLMRTAFAGADLSDPRNNEVELPNQASLVRAIKTGNLDSVKKICEANPDSVFQRDFDRNIALHYAAESKHLNAFEIVAYLVFDAQANSCINTRGKYGYTPLDLACTYGTKNVIDYLKANGAENNHRGFVLKKKLCFNYDEATDEATTESDDEEENQGNGSDQDEVATDREYEDEQDDYEEEGYLSQEYDSEQEY
jgi:ankyrin repeat protein